MSNNYTNQLDELIHNHTIDLARPMCSVTKLNELKCLHTLDGGTSGRCCAAVHSSSFVLLDRTNSLDSGTSGRCCAAVHSSSFVLLDRTNSLDSGTSGRCCAAVHSSSFVLLDRTNSLDSGTSGRCCAAVHSSSFVFSTAPTPHPRYGCVVHSSRQPVDRPSRCAAGPGNRTLCTSSTAGFDTDDLSCKGSRCKSNALPATLEPPHTPWWKTVMDPNNRTLFGWRYML